MDLTPYAEAGLYDPEADNAAERAELLAFLVDQGCTLEEMLAANERGRLFALAGDRIIRPDRDRFTLAQVAEQVGAPLDIVRSFWRAAGLVDPGPETAVASPVDVQMVRTVYEMSQLLGLKTTLGLARVIGSSMARIGDAMSTAVRGNLPAMSVAVSGSELTTAQAFAGVASAVPRIGAAIETLYRHHLETARMHFERTESWDVVGSGGIRVGVGFADLSGFTGLTQQLTLEDLTQLLSTFEEVATDVVLDHGGRVVKFLGDAVMFVTHDARTAVDVAEALLDAARIRGMTARAGVTVGTALALDGDYFGPIVNLAARLVAIAQPGTVLVSDEVAERLAGERAVVALGPQPIRGFSEPVAVSRLAPAV